MTDDIVNHSFNQEYTF